MKITTELASWISRRNLHQGGHTFRHFDSGIMHKLALVGQVLHKLFKNDQPINMKDSLADPRAFSHPTLGKGLENKVAVLGHTKPKPRPR